MTVPAPDDKQLSEDEIVKITDMQGAQTLAGYVPSEHFSTETIVHAYRAKQHGIGSLLYDFMTTNPKFIELLFAGQLANAAYDSDDTSFEEDIKKLTGEDLNAELAVFLSLRSNAIAKRMDNWPNDETKLAMLQLDSFLLGWVAARRTQEN